MFIISHVAQGYLASAVIQSRYSTSDYKLFLWLCISFSVFPDIDGVFSATVAGHHSILHTPIFWIAATSLIYVIGRKFYPSKNHIIAWGVFLGTNLHLITNWITARTVGIQWFYPFITKNYHLYSIYPEKGQIPVYEMVTNPYWSFYMENKLLFGFEIGLNLLAVILLFINTNTQKKGT